MAADVAKRIGVLHGTPILKIRVPVRPLFEQARTAEAELAESPRPVEPAGHEAAIVKPLVIIDAHEKAARAGLAFNFLRFGRAHDQGLHGTNVKTGAERGQDHVAVQWIRDGDNSELTRRGRGQHALVGFRCRLEALFRKRLPQRLRGGQPFERAAVARADPNRADQPKAPELIE